MAADILDLELAVKLLIDFQIPLVLLRPDMREFRACCLLALLTLLRQAVDAEQLGGGVGGRPVGEEDVVLEIEGGEVADVVTKGFDGGADVGG